MSLPVGAGGDDTASSESGQFAGESEVGDACTNLSSARSLAGILDSWELEDTKGRPAFVIIEELTEGSPIPPPGPYPRPRPHGRLAPL